ncbi:prepilin peptidase [Rathayibacter tanaceti]|uniref:prepilin peptidase n=1 Tax=Rathayibacter tanaceti TaxID=1671680 RepID=UPI0009EF1F79|nr:prepilin peptidase [Rathayibacter tanaceti]
MSNPSVADRAALVLGAAALLVVAAHRGVPGLLPVALLTVPLVLVDVRERRLPNVLTLPLLVLTAVPVLSAGALAAVLGTGVALWMLHGSGGLGLGDVKLGAALAPPLAQLGADRVSSRPRSPSSWPASGCSSCACALSGCRSAPSSSPRSGWWSPDEGRPAPGGRPGERGVSRRNGPSDAVRLSRGASST